MTTKNLKKYEPLIVNARRIRNGELDWDDPAGQFAILRRCCERIGPTRWDAYSRAALFSLTPGERQLLWDATINKLDFRDMTEAWGTPITTRSWVKQLAYVIVKLYTTCANYAHS